LSQDLEKQRRTDFPATVNWDCDGTAIRMIPSLTATLLAGFRKSELPCSTLKFRRYRFQVDKNQVATSN
jgi:hypothetical protein